MRRKWALLVLFLVLLAAVAAGFLWFRRVREVQNAKAVAPQQAPAPVSEISLPGRIQAQEVLKIAAPIDGRIIAFHAEVGDEVYEGQLLAEISNQSLSLAQQNASAELEKMQERVNNLESEIAAARLEASRSSADAARGRSELDRATRNYTRQKMLIAEGATPRLTFEKAEKEYLTLQSESKNLDEVARAAEARVSALINDHDNARKRLETKTLDLEAATARVDAGQIFSPVNGTVTGRRGAAGDEVHPVMDDLFQIATDLSSLEVVVEPSPAHLPRIQPGQAALITVADLPNEALSGVVSTVEGGRVTIAFSNPSPLVKPGHTAQVRIRLT